MKLDLFLIPLLPVRQAQCHALTTCIAIDWIPIPAPCTNVIMHDYEDPRHAKQPTQKCAT